MEEKPLYDFIELESEHNKCRLAQVYNILRGHESMNNIVGR